ncbi:MAG: TonB-dependent receptor plug domain-containing protein [Vicinamibacterales bacterium]
MSIEDLMNVDVTSVSRTNQRLADAAAAVFVVTSEDIRRSGATNIPDALRLVPGIQVAQIDANKWSVSVRGFNGRYSTKLLVLVDGRSVYMPLESGVLWDALNIPMDSIDHVEVIRGPGATLWGANAVNGVINIITRSATAYNGVHLSVGTGTSDKGTASLSMAGNLGSRTAIGVDVSGASVYGSVPNPVTGQQDDDWQTGRLGVRLDSRLSDHDDLMAQGAYARSHIQDTWLMPTLTPPFTESLAATSQHESAFGNVRWTHRGSGGDTEGRVSFEHSVLREVFLVDHRNTLDIDVQRTQKLAPWNEVVFGADYRRSADDVSSSPWVTLSPSARVLQWQSMFAQDAVDAFGARLRLTIGAKAEHNDYTGWELQPNVRGVVTISPRQTAWAAVSRAVRLPSRLEADGLAWFATATSPESLLPQVITIGGVLNNARAEVLIAREVGYRYRVSETASVDVSAYDSSYSDLRTVGAPRPVLSFVPVPHLDVLLPTEFAANAHRRGLEVSAEWRPAPAIRVNGYSGWLSAGNTVAVPAPGVPPIDDPPARQSAVRASINLPRSVELDVDVRHVSRLELSGVPAYTTADARLGFRLQGLDLAIVGRNLLAAERLEFVPEVFGMGRAAAERSLYFQVSFRR